MGATTSKTRNSVRWGKIMVWWSDHPSVDADHLAVLSVLSGYADDTGTCYPSQAKMALRLKRSRPWVNRVIADLTRIGIIEKTARTRTANAGTTSCEYKLALEPCSDHAAEPGVTGATGTSHDDDTDRHGGDTTQPITKQNNHARPMRDPSENPDVTKRGATEREPVPADWTPSAETMRRARTVSPDEDLETHAFMFANRSRSKGYLFARGRVDEAWLAWLAEDRLKHHRKGTSIRPGRQRTTAGRARDPGERRFEAWAVAAAAPKLRAVAPESARPEGDNPWR